MVINIAVEDTETVVLAPEGEVAYAGVGMYLCNVSTSDEVINIHLVQAGDNPAPKNTIIKELTVKAGETFEFGYEKLIINGGERIIISGENGGRVNATITFIQISGD